MQTFLPFSSLNSIKYLDPSRLGNQVYREGVTLIRGKWKNHPVSKMWKGHEHSLALYCLYGLDELKKRGRFYPKWYDFYQRFIEEVKDTGLPSWFGDERLHSSHRASLLAKNYEWYSKFGWMEEPKIDYFWPQLSVK